MWMYINDTFVNPFILRCVVQIVLRIDKWIVCVIILFTDSTGDASSNKLLFQVPEDVIGSGVVLTGYDKISKSILVWILRIRWKRCDIAIKTW
jgi:hypothetical protein